MAKPRIIIADMDISYIIPLQLKFVEEFFEKIDIEIITDKDYYQYLFSSPQKADILVVSEELYDISLQRHNLENIFLMTEKYEDDQTGDLNVNRIFKYTSIKEILNEIIGKSGAAFKLSGSTKKETQIILIYSACGGVGKTTLALGMSATLTKNYKRVLYINAGHIQSFQRMMDNNSAITVADVYAALSNPSENAYDAVRHVIRQEFFYYLPPFKAALMSLGLEYSVYERIVTNAKKSLDYDYIIVDADLPFDEDKAKLMDIADKVILVTTQNDASVYATNLLVSNISGANADKYMFICNDFKKEEENALISPKHVAKFAVSDYVDHFEHYDGLSPTDFAKCESIQRISFLVI